MIPKNSLELEDFISAPKRGVEQSDSHKEDNTAQRQLEQLKAAHNAALEETKKEAFDAGYRQAEEELSAVWQQELTKKLEQKERECSERQALEGSIIEEVQSVLQAKSELINTVILDSLAEMMEYLYVDRTSEKYVASLIVKIIEEFQQTPEISVRLHPTLADGVGGLLDGVKVVADETVARGDFVVDFADFLIESEFNDKIEVIKNEIKKEIEKSSQI
jgi:flagellar assembly protein FliH